MARASLKASPEIPPQLRHLPVDLALYCMQFPRVPEWFANVQPQDIVVLPPGRGPRMADAEDGEQPDFDYLPPPEEHFSEEEIARVERPLIRAA